MAATIQTIEKPTRARALDTSGNNNHGQIYSGRALEFDGVSDYLDVGKKASDLGITNNMTTSLWMKAPDATNQQIALNFYAGTSDGLGIKIVSDTIYIYDDIDNANQSLYTTAFRDNTWYRVVMVIDSLEAKLYINGVLAGSGTSISDGLDSFNSNIYIGNRKGSGGSEYFSGLISDVQIWDSAWTAADALYDYNNPESLALNNTGTSLTNSNLKLWYPMNDGHRGQQSYILDASNTGLGDTVLTNGDFTNWTGDNPDSWTVLNEDANNYVTEVSGQCRMYSNNTATIQIKQSNVIYAGVTYRVDIDIVEAITGTIRFQFNGANFTAFGSVGSFTHYITPTSDGYFAITRNEACDITFDNVVVKPVNDKNHATTVFKGDELITVAKDKNMDASNNWDVSSANWSIDGNSLDYDGSGGGNTALDQTYPAFVAGRTYEMKFNTSANDTIITIKDGDGSNTFVAETTYTSGTKTVTFAAPATTDGLMLTAGGSSAAFAIDWINIKELGTASGWTDADQQLDIPQTALQSYNQFAWFDGYKTDTAATLDSQILWEVGQTINMWVYPNVLNQYDSIFGDRNTRDYIRMGKSSGSYSALDEIFQFEMHDNLTSVDGQNMRILADAAGTLEVGKWLMWTFIWNADRTVDWYENGKKKGDSPATADTTDGKKMEVKYFGAGYGTSSQPFEGAMTEISHYTDILTESEINDLYNDGKAKSALEASGSGGLSLYLRNNGLAEWKDLKGSNDANVDSAETMLITAGADATRDSQGFLMNRQRTTNSLNLDYGGESGGWVDLGSNTTFAAGSAFSITLWLKPQHLGDNRFIGNTPDYIRFRNTLGWRMNANSAVDDFSVDSGAMNINEWVHLGVVRNTSNLITIYRNGEAQSDTETVDEPFDIRFIGAFRGTAADSSDTFKGELDDICIYEDELSAAEIKRNYNAGKRSHR